MIFGLNVEFKTCLKYRFFQQSKSYYKQLFRKFKTLTQFLIFSKKISETSFMFQNMNEFLLYHVDM